MAKLFLCISVLLNILLGFLVYRATRGIDSVAGGYIVKQHGRFAIMTKRAAPDDSFIVAFDDGRFYWTIQTNMLSVNVGVEQSFTLRLDASAQRIESTLLEFGDAKSGKTYIADMNADGIPERRRIGTQSEVFFGGDFYLSTTQDGKRVMIKDGQVLEVTFDGKRWVAKGD